MNYEIARRQMLSQQIRAWDVLDPAVLAVLQATPRELFVPESDRDLAFADTEVPLGHGQCMMAPKVEARLLQELAIESSDSVLEIGTGSGYLTACLSQLAGTVQTIEIFADLCGQAEANLDKAGVNGVQIRNEDATSATLDTRFDVIAMTASVPTLSDRWLQLLKPMGRLFVVVGRAPVMEARLIRMHSDGSYSEKSLFETVLTPMINADQPETFVL